MQPPAVLMNAVLSHRFVALHNPSLPGWIALSLAAHMLVLSFSGGIAPTNAPPRHASMTVDISYITPENPIVIPTSERVVQTQASMSKVGIPLAVSAPESDVPPQHDAPRSPSSNTIRKASDARAGPPVEVGQSFPFDTYLSVSDVDVRSEPINEVLLYYPTVAYIRRLDGVVQFRLFISAQGELDKAELIDAKPRGIFEEAAWDAVNKLKFSPASKNGRPVKSQKTIDVVFDPNDNTSKPVTKRPDSSVAEK
jgi:periplasmic protein TonB